MVFARIAVFGQGTRSDLETSQNFEKLLSQSDAAKLLNVSAQSGRDAKVILSSAPDFAAKIEAGEMTVCQAKRKLDIQAQIESISKLQPIEGLFDVIVIDPPWQYDMKYDERRHRGASPYPEMSLEELRLLKVPAADNCILWLWATERFLCEARQLLEIWGFVYKGLLIWDKQRMGLGSFLRCQCEFCWLGIKGKPIWRPTALRNIISSPRTRHSEKPDAFYKMVNENFQGAKLDMFARKPREGFTVWGNELEQVTNA
jgi:N6-adenosine-specific RNA methylase IME4